MYAISESAELHCTEHEGKGVEAFCSVCSIPLCIQCILTNEHKGHDMLSLQQAESHLRSILEQDLNLKVKPANEQLR